jgi:hypothetical protein
LACIVFNACNSRIEALSPATPPLNLAPMPSRLAALFLFAALALASRAADAEFLRVWPGWRDASYFDHIDEYFGDGQHASREIVLRTRADARAGYYMLVRVRHAAALANAKFVLHVIRPDAPEPKQFVFSVPSAPAGETVFQLGLTGADWPAGKDAHPVAWDLELRSGDDRVLVEEKSFLWEKPAK